MPEVKIVPMFIGRMGNNLFQIAASIGYAKKYNVGWGIHKGYIERGFGVNQVDRFFPHLPETYAQFRRYDEPCFNYQEIPFRQEGIRLVGFWQSWKYFEGAEEEVRKWLRVPIVKGYEDYVSIHVRRGDYVQHSGSFPPITIEYIRESIRQYLDVFNRRSSYPTQKIIVFSDDIEWCKNNQSGMWNHSDVSFEFSEGRNEFEDLSLMASCGNNIISNSTLAWWGAWLNPNPDKIVICPHHLNWFGLDNMHRFNTFDLFPPDWKEIKFR